MTVDGAEFIDTCSDGVYPLFYNKTLQHIVDRLRESNVVQVCIRGGHPWIYIASREETGADYPFTIRRLEVDDIMGPSGCWPLSLRDNPRLRIALA